MSEKIRLLVKVDIDGARIRITAAGHLTSRSLAALYVVVRRANTLMAGLALEIDVTGATVDPAALEGLRHCARSRHLPPLIDPRQSEVKLSLRPSPDAVIAA